MTFMAYAVEIFRRYLEGKSTEGSAKKKPHDIGGITRKAHSIVTGRIEAKPRIMADPPV